MKIYKILVVLISVLSLPLFAMPTIYYKASAVGGNVWLYEYTVVNDSAQDIDEFSIWFDNGSYDDIAKESSALIAGGWDELVVQPGLILNQSDGLYDALAEGNGIAPGQTVTGFAVSCKFLGIGVPGQQRFDIVNISDYSVISSGLTTPWPVSAVPSPAAVFLSGVGTLIAMRIRRR
ncbi:MAG: hypothetical protein JW745_09575 [Sedimentisphaerales bacterium]|nr:hypothetical protein [Sedimentisphaerales bacterium]MBN2842285.1 hypothetical protein [Sedimentisphaerales bacterium]